MIAVLALCLFVPCAAGAELEATPSATPTEHSVDQLFAQCSGSGTPGASIAVIENGKTIYSKGYGLANLEYGVPNTPATVFHLASVSKQFTAFAIYLLAQDGKLFGTGPALAAKSARMTRNGTRRQSPIAAQHWRSVLFHLS